MRSTQQSPQVRGPVWTPGQDGYRRETSGFNLAVEHRPEIVVGATGPGDVAEAVRHAAARGLPVTVQATGHGGALPAAGGLLISTRRMDGVRVDPVRRTARAGAGARWDQVVRAAAAYGLAPLNGSSPRVGVVGYTLGGGLPVLGRTYGWAADRVTAFELVTAAGEQITVTGGDLFWALRGGGKGGFGVVTEVEFGLVPVRRLHGGSLYFGGDAARDLLAAWREWTGGVPEEMNSSIALLRLPDAEGVPAPLRGRLSVQVTVAFTGSAMEGEALVRPLRAVAAPLIDAVGEMPYGDVAHVHNDPTEPNAYHETSLMLRDLPAERLLDLDDRAIVTAARHLGGALSRRTGQDSALGHRDAAYAVLTVSPEPAPLDALAPWSTGLRFANFLGGPSAAPLAREAYDPASLARLAELRATHDPDGVFAGAAALPAGKGEL
ncbi:FAD-binding oxidoreductase [Bailinhaonella thermotolerans]|uniref:FAD-binding oxidoreductase n=1 Tax=Bailinhaonella thermotolerans TaxID=1070861 RepID=A0A3A4ACT1_9ACTN|nr:FAD-binding oxidoreductase [Bailinhaonella thermotolerans]RJL24567.1 FAD-binding oxidoreductase [Bailinhaonella thermotolerans]